MDVIKYSMNLVLDEGPINDIYNKVREPEERIEITCTKSKRKFCLSLHYNGITKVMCMLIKQIFLNLIVLIINPLPIW